MNRVIALAIAFALWTVVSFTAGWQVRDGSADTAAAVVETDKANARADAVTDARATDHANSGSAAQSEQKRVDQAADSQSNFRVITREVVRYVNANPDPAGCDLDGDGLRAWRAANAGTFDHAGPDDPGGSTGRVPAGASAAR